MEAALAVAGLIALADLVATKGYKYYSASKGAIPEINELLHEVTGLYGILNSLHLVIVRLGVHGLEPKPGPPGQPGVLDQAIIKSEYLMTCRNNLERLNGILTKFDQTNLSKLALLKLKLLWPLNASETKEITRSIQQNKTNILLALQVNELSALVSALKGQEVLQNLMEQIQNDQVNIVKRLEKIQLGLCNIRALLSLGFDVDKTTPLDGEKQRVLDWASSMNAQASHQGNLKLRYTGTAGWFSDRSEYQIWKSTRNGRLWLFGIPGAGKTVMISSIIESIIDELGDDDAIAFHYCDYKSKDSQVLENILSSLIMQTSKQSDVAFKKLKKLYDTHNPGGSSHLQLRDCNVDLVNVLQQLSKPYANLTIVVDGLDECTTGRDELVRQLDRLPDTGSSRIKILVASRLEQDLENSLSAFDQIEVAASPADVQLYVASVIEDRVRTRKLKIRDPSLKDLILHRLVEGCKGISRRNALDNLPPGLNGIYQNILERIVSSEYGDDQPREYLLRTLRWLAFSEAPLTLGQLTEAIADIITPEGYYDSDSIVDEESIMHWGSSLVRLNRQTSCLEFSHFTVRDFLLEGRNQLPPPLHCFKLNSTDSQLWLAKFCLKYLMLKNFQETYNLEDDSLIELYVTYPFLKYADQFWDTHARAALRNQDDDLNCLVQTFFAVENNPYFPRWRRSTALLEAGTTRFNRILTRRFFEQDGINLHFAAAAGLLCAVESLVRQRASINALNPACGTPLSAALWKLYEGIQVAEGTTGNMGSFISNDYNNIISMLLSAGANINLSLPKNNATDPLFAFFQSKRYDPTVAESLFSRLDKPVSKAVARALSRRLEGGWITGTQAIQLINLSASECWDRNNKLRICQAMMTNKASEAEVVRLLEGLGTTSSSIPDQGKLKGDDEKHTDVDEAEVSPIQLQRSSTFEEAITAQCLIALLSAAKEGMTIAVDNLISKYPKIVGLPGPGGWTALAFACEMGHETIVTRLLSHGASVNVLTEYGYSPLHLASRAGRYGCVQLLLAAGADVNMKCSDGRTPLMLLWSSCIHSIAHWQDISDALLSSKVDFSIKTRSEETYLHFAASLPEAKYLKILLDYDQKLDVDAQRRSDRSTPLHIAAWNRNSDILPLLLSHNVTVDARDGSNRTPLMNACLSGSSDTITILVQAGADMIARNNDGLLPQHFASISPDPGNIATLLRAGRGFGNQISIMEPCDGLGETVLHYAALNESPQAAFEIVKQLLKEPGINVDGIDSRERLSPLMVAAARLRQQPPNDKKKPHSRYSPCSLRLQVLKALLERSSSPNCLSTRGMSAFASVMGITCWVCWNEATLAFIAHPETHLETKTTDEGHTPLLMLLAFGGPYARVARLLDLGANATATTLDGRTAQHMIENSKESAQISDLLLAKGADVNAKCLRKRTPLIEASENGNLELVRRLIENGANVSDVDDEGFSAIHIAIVYCRDALLIGIVEVLLNSGTPLNTCSVAREGRDGFAPLLHAILLGKLDVARLLLDQNSIDVFATSSGRKFGIWHMAVNSPQPELAIGLLAEKKVAAPINLAENAGGETPLLMALTSKRSEEVVKLLVAAGSDVFAESHGGLHSLQCAINFESVACVRLLLEHIPRVDCSCASERKIGLHFWDNSDTPRNPEIIKFILRHHENITLGDVFRICEWGDLDDETYALVASFIREEKIYTKSNSIASAPGYWAYVRAKRHGNSKFQAFLEEWIIHDSDDLSSSDSDSSLSPIFNDVGTKYEVGDKNWFDETSMSIVSGKFTGSEIQELLSAEGFKENKNVCFPLPCEAFKALNRKYSPAITILQVALMMANFTAIQTLFSNGCLLSARDSLGRGGLFSILDSDDHETLAFVANILGSLESREEHKIDIKTEPTRFFYEGTVLHFLARTGGWRCVRSLIENASLFFKDGGRGDLLSITEVKNYYGWTPIRTAVENNNLRFIEELFKIPRRSQLDEWEFNGATSLKRRAIELGFLDIADFLTSHCPDSRVCARQLFNSELEVFSIVRDFITLEALLRAGSDLDIWDASQGHPVHYLLKAHKHLPLEVILSHMGTDRAISQLTKRALVFGNGLEIVGHERCEECLDTLKGFFGPDLSGIPSECIEEGGIAAIKQGHLEFAASINLLLISRSNSDSATAL
ncbi:hypothetical protein TWF281_007927 [Arthrobotrys megalospora]